MASSQTLAPNDWFEHPELLPPRPLGLTETKYTRRFAVDLHGAHCHDQYVFMAPNGLAVIGLAPSHPLVAAHRRATGYQPTLLRYIPPQIDHLGADDLVSAVADEEAQEDADRGAGAAASAVGEAAATAADSSGAAGAGAGAGGGTGEGGDAAQPGQAGGTGGDGGGGGGGAAGSRGPAPSAERPPAPQCEPFPPQQCSRVNFEAGAARSLLAAHGGKASGKKRGRGAAQLRGSSLLAQVERRGGGASFPVWCILRGQLLEVNERLAKTPSLLYDRPCREGYVAILSPSPEAVNFFQTQLLSESDYLRLRGLTAEDLL